MHNIPEFVMLELRFFPCHFLHDSSGLNCCKHKILFLSGGLDLCTFVGKVSFVETMIWRLVRLEVSITYGACAYPPVPPPYECYAHSSSEPVGPIGG